MRSAPQQLAAPFAPEKLIARPVSQRRGFVHDAVFGQFLQLAAACHASPLAAFEDEFVDHVGQLFDAAELWGYEQGFELSVANNFSLEHRSVGRQEYPPGGQGCRDDDRVVDSMLELGVVTRGPEPSGQTAQHRIAEECGLIVAG